MLASMHQKKHQYTLRLIIVAALSGPASLVWANAVVDSESKSECSRELKVAEPVDKDNFDYPIFSYKEKQERLAEAKQGLQQVPAMGEILQRVHETLQTDQERIAFNLVIDLFADHLITHDEIENGISPALGGIIERQVKNLVRQATQLLAQGSARRLQLGVLNTTLADQVQAMILVYGGENFFNLVGLGDAYFRSIGLNDKKMKDLARSLADVYRDLYRQNERANPYSFLKSKGLGVEKPVEPNSGLNENLLMLSQSDLRHLSRGTIVWSLKGDRRIYGVDTIVSDSTDYQWGVRVNEDLRATPYASSARVRASR